MCVCNYASVVESEYEARVRLPSLNFSRLLWSLTPEETAQIQAKDYPLRKIIQETMTKNEK